MRRSLPMITGLLLLSGIAFAASNKPTRFWNLTSATITKLQLSPVGQDAFGANQCENDPDGSVDHDERLKILGVGTGRYDVRLTQKNGRICLVRDVAVKDGSVFSIEDKDLTDCK